MEKHVVIGAGEVGRAVAAVLQDKYDVYLRDVEGKEFVCDVLHICFPYTKEFFNSSVEAYRRIYHPRLTIIHSTVPVGTTARHQQTVHSPVTGRHPNLEEGVRTFVKFFGGPMAFEAADVFENCGVMTYVVEKSEETEAGKLWQTLQYGWQIIMQKEIYKYCEDYEIDPKIVYDAFNAEYNDGYGMLNEPFFLPILKNMPGPIGGHCVVPNTLLMPAEILGTLLRTFDSIHADDTSTRDTSTQQA